MKNLFLLITVFFFISCTSQKQVPKKITNSIEDIYFQNWVAGVRGGGAGIGFHVRFKQLLPDDNQLEKVLFKGKEAVFYSQDKLHYIANIVTRKGSGSKQEEADDYQPIPESNKAVLYFKSKGQTEIYTVEDVREIEMLAYPSMNKPR